MDSLALSLVLSKVNGNVEYPRGEIPKDKTRPIFWVLYFMVIVWFMYHLMWVNTPPSKLWSLGIPMKSPDVLFKEAVVFAILTLIISQSWVLQKVRVPNNQEKEKSI